MSAVTTYFVYCGDGGMSVNDVNILTDSMSRQRMWESHDGINLHDLYVMTNYDEDLFYKPAKIINFKDEGEGFWNILNLYRTAGETVDAEHKVVVIQGHTRVKDVVSILSLENIPEKGCTNSPPKPISDEDRVRIATDNLIPTQQFINWWDDTTEYSPYYLASAASSYRELYKLLNTDSVKEDYDPTPIGLQQAIEVELGENLYWVESPKGASGIYYLNDRDSNEELNESWETVVRPYFNNGDCAYGWRGIGGDSDSKYLEFTHEYRDLNRQTSFFTVIGDESEYLQDDYYRLWISRE